MQFILYLNKKIKSLFNNLKLKTLNYIIWIVTLTSHFDDLQVTYFPRHTQQTHVVMTSLYFKKGQIHTSVTVFPGSRRHWPVGFPNDAAICSSLRPAHRTSSRRPGLLQRAPCTLKTGLGTQPYSALVHHLSESQGIFWSGRREGLTRVITCSLKQAECEISLAYSSLTILCTSNPICYLTGNKQLLK